MNKKLKNLRKKFIEFENVNPQTKKNEDLKAKALDNIGDLFDESYYIYQERQEEEKDALNKKGTKKFDYTKSRVADNYLYESEEEDKQTNKKPDKKEPPKKSTKSNVQEFHKLIIRKKMGINSELFKKCFSFQMPTVMLKVYIIQIKRKIKT